MKHYVMIILVVGGILFANGESQRGAASDSPYYSGQKFPIEKYQKVIIHNDILYLSDGQGTPSGYNASLFTAQLGRERLIPQRLRIHSGVYVENMDLEGKLFMIPEQYQFCWDIVESVIISMNVEEPMDSQGIAGCSLVGELLSDLPVFTKEGADNLRLNFSEPEALISSPFPLFSLFLRGGGERKSEVFFDFTSFDKHSFHLYIAFNREMSIWNYDVKEEGWKKEWQRIASFPIDFEGPFWTIQLEERVYILSEIQDTVYRLDKNQGLVPFFQLPYASESQERMYFQHQFVVDKDRQQLLFFVPSFSETDTPTVISIGETTGMRQGLKPALRSMLEISRMRKE